MDWACPLRHVLCACPLSLLILRSGVLNRTLSHIWWSLYLHMFLLSVGLLTLMYIDTFIVLARPLSSLSIMLKFSWVVLWPVWVLYAWMGEGSLRCSLYFSPGSWMTPLCITHCMWVLHTGTGRWPHFSSPLGPCLGLINNSFIVLFPLKWVCIPYLL